MNDSEYEIIRWGYELDFAALIFERGIFTSRVPFVQTNRHTYKQRSKETKNQNSDSIV